MARACPWPGQASGGRRRRSFSGHRTAAAGRLAIWLGAVAVLAGGCVSMPTSGSVQQISVQAGGGQDQNFPQVIPMPPGDGWLPIAIVHGFLAASATFADDHAVARQYLTPQLARQWRPSWAATVVKSTPLVRLVQVPNQPSQQPRYAKAQITVDTVATVSPSGQYLPGAGSGSLVSVALQRVGGQWRIAQLPSFNSLPSLNSLILTQAQFTTDYAPSNLYYFFSLTSPSPSLIPDPVFVPQDENPAESATGLVSALRQDPGGWLQGAAVTGFPAGTKLNGEVSVSDANAIVDLGGAAARASGSVLRRMKAQIALTLTSSSYSPSAIRSVQLKIDHRLVSQRLLLRQHFTKARAKWLPTRLADGVYYLNRYRKVSELSGSAKLGQMPWPARARVTQIAVAPGTGPAAPGGGEIAGIVPLRHGCRIFAGQPRRGSDASSWKLTGGPCTSMSFDRVGNIWAAAGSHVYFLPVDGGSASSIMTQFVSASDTISALRVAPDGVRVAMIVRDSARSATVLLGAISSTGTGTHEQLVIGQGGMLTVAPGVRNPGALSWYDTYSLLVLSNAGTFDSQLYKVPLAGGTQTAINTAPDTLTIATSGSAEAGGSLYAGTTTGKIKRPRGPNLPWPTVVNGTDPVEPG